MHFHEDELESVLAPIDLERGRIYQAEGRVVSAELQKGGTLVAAMVRGSRRKHYKLLIRLARTKAGGLDVTGQCSCPVHYNCKHVAAVLLEVAERAERHPPSKHASGLPPDLGIWFERLQQVDRRERSEEIPECLLFLLDVDANYAGSFVTVTTVKTRHLKQGGYGEALRFTAGSASTARFVGPEDQRILSLLETGRQQVGGSYVIHGLLGSQILDALLQTGRCHWASADEPELQLGKPLRSGLVWELEADGTQSVRAEQAEEGTLLLPVAPPWYLDLIACSCGPLETGLPDTIAEALAAAPPVSFDQADALARALEESFPDQRLPTPREPDVKHRDDVPAVPCLRLRSEQDEVFFPGEDEPWDDVAELYFDYAGLLVHPLDEEPLLAHRRDERLELVLRHADDEIAHFERLVELGFEPDETLPDEDYLPMFPQGGDRDWIDFVLVHLPALREEGWRIEIDPSFRFRLVESDDWYAALDEKPGENWFNIELGVEIGGERVNLLPILATYLRQVKSPADLETMRMRPDDFPLLCRLEDGRLLRLPLGRARHVIDVLTELYDPTALDRHGRIRLSRYQSTQLADLVPDGKALAWDGGEALLSQGERLRNFAGIQPVGSPPALRAELRPYQREGLNWLQFLREFELGGILADDMGLGKTVQALAHLLVEKAAGRADRPSLVVAPTSLMLNWRREAERFAPELKVLTLQGLERKQRFAAIPESDLVLTTYPLLPRDADELLAHAYHLLILDEAQHIKNPKAKAAQAAQRLDARHRLCLTGTPLENHLGELWAQFQFLMPGLLGDERRFRKIFRTPIEKHADAPRRERLRRRIAPFMLRREKAQVANDLPPKTEILNEVDLTGAQRDLYETIRLALHDKIRQAIDKKGIQRSQIVILDALLKLRQVCCDPRLLKMDAARKVKQSAKLEMLGEMLPEMVEEGRRVLLFSQFTSMLALIEERLKADGIDYVKLTGRTRDRAAPIDRFQNGNVPVFLISLKAGGFGLNLTAADSVIHYDPWWNPAVERQATDRAHRIGQDKPIFVYKLIARGTVEEKIAALQAHKQELADALFGGGGSAALSAEDLQALFEPLK